MSEKKKKIEIQIEEAPAPKTYNGRLAIIAILLMIGIKVFLIDGVDQYTAVNTGSSDSIVYEEGAVHISIDPENLQGAAKESAPLIEPESGHEDAMVGIGRMSEIPDEILASTPAGDFDLGKELQRREKGETRSQEAIKQRKSAPHKSRIQPIQAHVIEQIHYEGRPRVVVILDDMGMSYKYTDAAIDLPGPLTLAFLPYAERLDETTHLAREKGHELLIHVPMEPMNSSLDLGPVGLKTSMQQDEFHKTLQEQVFGSFSGYVGINNHMGSRLTQDVQSMDWLMSSLKEQGLLFVDSRTISTSIAEKTASEYGVPHAGRDVFLDHYEDLRSVRQSLMNLETIAQRKGIAIAIGHPKKNTILALKEWLPTLDDKGLELVRVSDVVTRYKRRGNISEIQPVENDFSQKILEASQFSIQEEAAKDDAVAQDEEQDTILDLLNFTAPRNSFSGSAQSLAPPPG